MTSISKASFPLTAVPSQKASFSYDGQINPAYYSSFVESGAVPALRTDSAMDEQEIALLRNRGAFVRSVFCVKRDLERAEPLRSLSKRSIPAGRRVQRAGQRWLERGTPSPPSSPPRSLTIPRAARGADPPLPIRGAVVCSPQ